jgi:hypothetical protein
VFHEPGAGLLVGRDAQDSARRVPGNFEPNPKRRIDDGEVLLGDEPFAVRDAIAAVLRPGARRGDSHARRSTRRRHRDLPGQLGATRRFVLTDAALTGGLPEPRLVPRAGRRRHLLRLRAQPRRAARRRRGGPTTWAPARSRASVVSRTGEGFEVLALDGPRQPRRP